MSETADIKRRLSAISQTRQITNAMYLISSTRMRREGRRVDYAKEYFYHMRATVKDIMEKSRGITHPYFEHRAGDRAAFLVIAGDKGLCGTYNSDVLHYAEKLINEHSAHYIETIGRVATEYFTRHGMTPDAETLGASNEPTLYAARAIAGNLISMFERNLIDELYVVFTRFVSSTESYPHCVRLLPFSLDAFEDVELKYTRHVDMIYEPSPEAVFNKLIPQCAVGLIFALLVQSSASEHSARMNSMRSATENADEMTQKLRREYQTQRQLSITNEIIEITAGAEGASAYRQ